ncbi:hypothetical protein [Acinetobacter sp. YH01016]|jgi:Tfp pilus assembly protein PilV|uniref:hypothetical protein n=2 Tax=Acinetobacter TaxID=469 RepID=UPI0015D46672|nr:hypothetical protein [Acinetobacter sp. YH01016]
MPIKNKSIFILLVFTVVIMNIFMISLLAYTLHTAREHAEAEARTGVENLTSLLEKSVSSSSQEIDLSLYTLQTYITRITDKKTA